MSIQFDDSKPMLNRILERCRETYKKIISYSISESF